MSETKIFYEDENICVRTLRDTDPDIFCEEENKQGWHSTTDKFWRRLRSHEAGDVVAMVAEYKGEPAGYINVVWAPKCGPFVGKGIPEIVDFAVLEKFRRNGIGKHLMDVAESVAAEKCDVVSIGVGMHNGYGSAQRMYVKRGYIPDGSGVWYQNQVWPQYKDCCNDDDLILYFLKEFK